MADEPTEELADAASTLLCAPAMGGSASDACVELLSSAPPSEASVLWVTYTRSAAACLEEWRAHVDEDPDRMAVVVLDDSGAGGGDAPDVLDDTETVGSPGDLTGLGITVGRYLEEWDGPITVCFDSLTALLQYTDLETAYEFLHTLNGRLYAVGAKSHFHLDPTAHDDRTVTVLTSLFDASVTIEDGERVVKTRFV